MRRHELTDEQVKKIEYILPGRKEHVGVTAKDNRNFITGAPWRDLPERYGNLSIVDFLVRQKLGFLTVFFVFYLKMQI
jgi:transposase